MRCAYCSTMYEWPRDFPVRTEAVCIPCGTAMYGWTEQAIAKVTGKRGSTNA